MSSEEESESGSVSVSESDDNIFNNDSSRSENTPLLVGVGQASPSLYQSFIRLIASEDLFAKFLFFATRTPVNSNSPKAEILKAFSEGTGLFTEKMWPMIFSSMLLHDGITYFTQPLDRYGNTFPDILGGVSPNQLSWSSSHLGGDRPDTVPFWIPIGAVLSLPLGFGIYRAIQKYRLPVVQPTALVVNDQSPLIAHQNVSRINTIRGQYALWSQGESKSILAHLLFLPLPLYVLYAKARLLEMIIQKIMQVAQYFNNKKACTEQNKQWVYMHGFGDYECTVCGESPVVYYNDVFTSQGCLNGLLSQPRTPEEIFKTLDQILKHPNFTQFDLSRQNWTTWAEPQWQVFLNKIANTTKDINILNLSRSILNPIFPDDGKIEDLAEFLGKVKINQLDVNNQNIGDSLFRELIAGFENNTLNYLDISSNQLTGESAARIAEFISSSKTLKTLKAAHNPFSDAGIQDIAEVLPNSTLTIVDVSDTAFGDDGVQSLATAISDKNSKVQILDISDNDLSIANTDNLGQAVGDSQTLESLDLSNTNIDDMQVSSFMPLAAKGNLRSLDVSNNPLTDQGMYIIVNDIHNSLITALYFNNNILTDDGMAAIAGILNSTILETIAFANAKSFSAAGIKKILENLPETVIQFDISGNDLGDDIADVFVNTFNNGTDCHLQKVYLGNNQLTDKGGEKLVRLFAVHNMTDLKLDHNQLTDKTVQVLAEVFPGSRFENLDFSHNQISGNNGTIALASKLPGSELQKYSAADNQIGDNAIVAIGKKLVTPTPHINDLGTSEISVDETRALRKTTPQTNLSSMDFRNNPTHSESNRALCRVLPNTKILVEQMGLDNLDNCQTSSAGRLRPFSFNFFARSEVNLPQNNYPVRPVYSNPVLSSGNNIQNNNINTNSSNAYLYLAAAFSPIMLLAVLYVLYRAFRSQQDRSPGFFVNHPYKCIENKISDLSDSDNDTEEEYSLDEESESENIYQTSSYNG